MQKVDKSGYQICPPGGKVNAGMFDDLLYTLDALELLATLSIDRRNPDRGVTITAYYPSGRSVSVESASIDRALVEIKAKIIARGAAPAG